MGTLVLSFDLDPFKGSPVGGVLPGVYAGLSFPHSAVAGGVAADLRLRAVHCDRYDPWRRVEERNRVLPCQELADGQACRVPSLRRSMPGTRGESGELATLQTRLMWMVFEVIPNVMWVGCGVGRPEDKRSSERNIIPGGSPFLPLQ